MKRYLVAFVSLALMLLSVPANAATKGLFIDNNGNVVNTDPIINFGDIVVTGSSVGPTNMHEALVWSPITNAPGWSYTYAPNVPLVQYVQISPSTNPIAITINIPTWATNYYGGHGVLNYDYSGVYYWTNDNTYSNDIGGGYYYCPTNLGKIANDVSQNITGSWFITTNIAGVYAMLDGTYLDATMLDFQPGQGFVGLLGVYNDTGWLTTGNTKYNLTVYPLATVTNTYAQFQSDGSMACTYLTVHGLNQPSSSDVTIGAGNINTPAINYGKPVTANTISSTYFNAITDRSFTNASSSPLQVNTFPQLYTDAANGIAGIAAFVGTLKVGEISQTTTTNTIKNTNIEQLTITVPAGSVFYFTNISQGGSNAARTTSYTGIRATAMNLTGDMPTFWHSNDVAPQTRYQLQSRTNLGGYVYLTGKITNTSLGSTYWSPGTPITMPTNFFLRGVTNILAPALGHVDVDGFMVGHAGIPISPRHCIGAAHVGGVCATNVFLLPDGTLYTNLLITQVNIPNTDIDVGIMANTNPSFMRIMPDISMKTAFNDPSNVPMCVMFHSTGAVTNYTAFVEPVISPGYSFGILSPSWTNSVLRFGDYSVGDTWVNGDSGAPAIVVLNNEAIFISAAHYGNSGPPPGLYIDQINAAMSNLSVNASAPIYKLSVYSSDNFIDY